MPTDQHAPNVARRGHAHMWLVGLLGVAAGLALLVYVPSLQGVSRSILLFAGFHVVGASVIAASGYLTWRTARPQRQLARTAAGDARPAFGSGPSWLNGPLVAGVVVAAVAVALQASRPALWPLDFLLVGQAVVFFVGARVVNGFRSADQAVLPMLDLVRRPDATVLDLGCGSGRSTVAIGAGPRTGIIAFDAFSDGDPRLARLQRNLEAAGLQDRVTPRRGSLSQLPFEDAAFHAVVSVNVLDSRAGERKSIMADVRRVLEPGGRFLVVVRTRSWSLFAALNVLVLWLAPPKAWRGLAQRNGFRLVQEGRLNHTWFMLLERPVE